MKPPSIGRLLNLNDNRRFFPKLFQLIKLALAGREDVHDCADIVHQNPPGLSRSFTAARFGVAGLERMFFDAVGNSLQLPFAGASAHDEIIHVWRQLAQIKEYDVFALLILNRVDDVVGKF